MFENTTNIYEKLERDKSNTVRCSISFLFFQGIQFFRDGQEKISMKKEQIENISQNHFVSFSCFQSLSNSFYQTVP